MFYIFEMANNHMGRVDHGKRIIDEFADVAKKHDLNAAIKLQFRQLDTFIHKDYLDSDLKYVKRFKETKLTQEQFLELVNHTKERGLKTCSTAFDNDSIPWFDELDISVVKVASCSIDDWPLLEQVSAINKKIIISTAGAEIGTLHKVYSLFKSKNRDFAFMHCVGIYPTAPHDSHLNRITLLKQEFPDIEIGYSTHEPPGVPTTSTFAMAMGCTILEKHVGVPTNEIKLNPYSLSPQNFENLMESINFYRSTLPSRDTKEKESLRALKRGMYFSREMAKGQVITKDDLYFCMPVLPDTKKGFHYDASNMHEVIGKVVAHRAPKDSPVSAGRVLDCEREGALRMYKLKISSLLKEAKISHGNEELEISAHFGLNDFHNTGCAIINRINREYCKKLIIVLPNQSHPTHRHIQKEECFELLYGDCTVILGNKEIKLKEGTPLLVPRNVSHSFRSDQGCVIEEVSTTHIKGDSIYDDPNINKLPLDRRKILTTFG